MKKNIIGEIQAIIMHTVINRPGMDGEELFYELIARGYDGADCVTAIKELDQIVAKAVEEVEVETPDVEESDVSSFYPKVNIRPHTIHNTKGGIH